MTPRAEGSLLSVREMQVLIGMSSGLTNEELAKQLYVGTDTVKTHLRHIYTVLGVRNNAHAVAIAYELGYLPREAPEYKSGRPSLPQETRLDRAGGRQEHDVIRRRKNRHQDLPEEKVRQIHQRYPSTNMGEQGWVDAFDQDPELFTRIVGDIVIKSHALRVEPLPPRQGQP